MCTVACSVCALQVFPGYWIASLQQTRLELRYEGGCGRVLKTVPQAIVFSGIIPALSVEPN